MEVGLRPSVFVLDGTQPPSPKMGGAPNLRRTSIVAKRLDGSRCHSVRRYRPRPTRHCVRWGPGSPPLKGHSPPPIFGPCLLWPNGWMDEDATWYGSRHQPRPHCIRGGPIHTAKGAQQPSPFSASVYYGDCRPSQLLLSSCFIRL